MHLRILLPCLVLATSVPALAQQPAPQAIPVGTVAAAVKQVTQGKSFVGRVEAVNRVDVQARVTGFLDGVLFTEGDMVAEGAPLYQIESAPFEADVQQAGGNVIRAQGEYENAKVQRARAEELVKTSAVSVAQRDQRAAEEQTAQGNLVVAQAKLKQAQINLSYTKITSPITGRIGRTAVTKGNVVSPTSGVLTKIVSVDPIYVTFPVSQREFLAIRARGDSVDSSKARVRLNFADGSTYPENGRIDFIDVSVDRATDTVLVRAVFPNRNGTLVDGEFAQVAVEGETPLAQIVIPQAALIADQEGVYVFVVVDGKATVRRVKTGGPIGPEVAINEGLKAGDIVIVQGLQALRPGAPVIANPIQPISGG